MRIHQPVIFLRSRVLIYNYLMTQIKFDYLIEAVHYSSAGDLEKIRVYERRGPSFSDRIIIDRNTLISALSAGKKVVSGSRVPYLASTFDITGELHLAGSKENPSVVLGDEISNQDSLPGIPVF